MVRRCVVLVGVACALLPASAVARAGAQALVDRAVASTLLEPGCAVSEQPIAATDAAPPASVLRRYGLLRTPQPAATDIVPVTFDGPGGLFARAYARTRIVSGITITAAPLLDWHPSVWPRACDARLLAAVRGLVASRPLAVRHAAERAVQRIVASNAAIRSLPPRTLLSLGVPGGIAVTGALALCAERGLFTRVEFPPSRTHTTFAGLVPDGITALTARSTAGRPVTATVHDNLVVLRLSKPRARGKTRTWQVFTSPGGGRPFRHLTAG